MKRGIIFMLMALVCSFACSAVEYDTGPVKHRTEIVSQLASGVAVEIEATLNHDVSVSMISNVQDAISIKILKEATLSYADFEPSWRAKPLNSRYTIQTDNYRTPNLNYTFIHSIAPLKYC